MNNIDYEDFAGANVKILTIDNRWIKGHLWMIYFEDETEEKVAEIVVDEENIMVDNILHIELLD